MKTIDNYTSQELFNIIHSRGDMVFLGGVIDRNNIESFFEYYNIECTEENKNKFFDNTDFINDIDDDVNLLMHELLKQAGFDVDNCE